MVSDILIVSGNPTIGLQSQDPECRDPDPFSQSRIPGLGDALIPSFRYYEKCKKCPNFTVYLPQKIPLSQVLGAIPDSKAKSERIRTGA